jgi:hypothetical protein
VTGSAADVERDLVQPSLDRIEDHLERLRAGHDLLGHLFSIERLARAARMELITAERTERRERSR